MPHLELAHLTKIFLASGPPAGKLRYTAFGGLFTAGRSPQASGATRAVHDLSLHVEHGEILSILGPSGCGKTTTLRMIAGLETPSSGSISSNGRDITRAPARSRNMGMVFQNYALFPHLDVFENIAFGLKTRRLGGEMIRQRVKKALSSVRMEDYERRSVHQLSGGQQQRIALARALAIEPEVLLLDEPLSNLDPSLREDLRDQIRSIIRELNVTTVFVTHDQQEAFALADRIAIMEAGICRQVGKPDDVYSRPTDAFVARFLGKANLLPGRLLGLSDGVIVMLRPENITVMAVSDRPRSAGFEIAGGQRPPLQGIISKAVFEGAIVTYTIEVDGASVTARQFHHGMRTFRARESVQIFFPDGQYHVIPNP